MKPILYIGTMSKHLTNKPKQDDLFKIADEQKGYFTAQQAITVGIPDSAHPYHIKAGNWIREQRGIYRLARYPVTEYENLIVWYLWSRDRSGAPQGIFSHETALMLYELSDANPSKTHMTVPMTFRRFHKPPKVLVLHKTMLKKIDITERSGIKITTPLRTLLDVATESALSLDTVEQAVQESVDRGIVMEKEIRQYPELARFLKNRVNK